MKGTINEGRSSQAVWQQWRRNIAKTKYMAVGILHKFYTVIYFKFKLQLTLWNNNSCSLNCKFAYRFTLQNHIFDAIYEVSHKPILL